MTKMVPDNMRTLVQVEPTTDIDIRIGVAVYHTTVNKICDLFLNLMPALTQGDLKRLQDVGLVARRELLAQTSASLQRVQSESDDADPHKSTPPAFGQRRTGITRQTQTNADVPHLGVIASERKHARKKTQGRAQT